MIRSAETRLEGCTLVVRIPMRFQRRGGRKRIVAPDGSELALKAKPQPDGTLIKALARAWRWQRMLDEGIYASVSEISDAENISKSYISRILRLALLAPDIVEAIVADKTDQALMLEKAGPAAADELGRSAQPLVSGQHPEYWHHLVYRGSRPYQRLETSSARNWIRAPSGR